MANFSFEVNHRSSNTHARTGIIKTRNGSIETPYFVPVATAASVRSLTNPHIHELGVQCTLANTYHLMLAPGGGDELIKKAGGLHKFMNFHKPIFTDSGGFQAFSLGEGMAHGVGKIGDIFPGEKPKDDKPKWAIIEEDGVRFKIPRDGSIHKIGPKESMNIQSNLCSDIIMAFDECTSPHHDHAYTSQALKRTHRWLLDSIKYHDKSQALYGIIQGGMFEDLRSESTQFILKQNVEGIAIGGSLGKSKSDMHSILDWVIPKLDSRPRHLLGIGAIDDIFECVERGIDTFDCVEPTRIARRGALYISPDSGGSQDNRFRIDIGKAKFAQDFSPIDPYCSCYTCENHSRAYLHHLFKAGERTYGEKQRQVSELTYFPLATIHNLHFMLNLMDQVRNSIKKDSFQHLKLKYLNK